MTLSRQFADDLAQILTPDDFAVGAVYRLNGKGDGFPLYVIPGDGVPFDQNAHGQNRETARVPVVAVRSVVQAKAGRDALRGDTVTVGAVVYTVENPENDEGGGVTLWCTRSERKAATMPGLRG